MEKKLSDIALHTLVTVSQLHFEKKMLDRLRRMGIYQLQTISVESKCAGGIVVLGEWGKVALDHFFAQNIIVRIAY